MRTFAVLQLLDLATTLLAFRLGGYEANPMVRPFLALGPIGGILLVKALVLALGFACWRFDRLGALHKASWLYAAIVVWNTAAILHLA